MAKKQNAKAGFAAAPGSASNVSIAAVIATHPIFQDDPKRMTEDEYVDFLVAQGMGRAQAKIFAAPHYRRPEN